MIAALPYASIIPRKDKFLPIGAEKTPSLGGDESVLNKIPVLIARMYCALRREHHFKSIYQDCQRISAKNLRNYLA